MKRELLDISVGTTFRCHSQALWRNVQFSWNKKGWQHGDLCTKLCSPQICFVQRKSNNSLTLRFCLPITIELRCVWPTHQHALIPPPIVVVTTGYYWSQLTFVVFWPRRLACAMRAPCVLACAMRSLAIVITIIQSLSLSSLSSSFAFDPLRGISRVWKFVSPNILA